MRKNGFVVLVLLVVIAAAAMSIWLFFHRDSDPAEQTPPPTLPLEETAPPERTPEPEPTRSPEPEPAPEPTETPAPTPEPIETPEPEPTPTPYPAEESGSFASDTGTALNLIADWTVYTDAAGNRKMDVALSATHYALRTDKSPYGLVLTVNGQRYSADCPALEYDGDGIAVTPLHTFTLDAPSGSADIEAVWHFKGSYSGQELEQITASDTAVIG